MTYVLFFMLWNASANSSHYVATQEFNSEQSCAAAAEALSIKFGGYGAHPYWHCAKK